MKKILFEFLDGNYKLSSTQGNFAIFTQNDLLVYSNVLLKEIAKSFSISKEEGIFLIYEWCLITSPHVNLDWYWKHNPQEIQASSAMTLNFLWDE